LNSLTHSAFYKNLKKQGYDTLMIKMAKIRQPIVTIAGHVDHGKTTILDSIRESCVAKKEAGGITQKISCTVFPAELIEGRCNKLLLKYNIKLEIPGFLFIDTPGHAAFTNLRKRGGSLADLAVLVIDINEGVMPQTQECIEILKASKVPFIVALNKIDAIHGWRKQAATVEENLQLQADYVKKDFDKKFYNIVSALSMHSFDADLFFRVNDFTKKLAMVPCSGKTGEGIPELIMMLCGLSQKFLSGRLQLGKEAKGTILEVKREKSMIYLESILYDGSLKQGDSIAIASFNEPIVSKVRTIFEASPLCRGFKAVNEVHAAAGIRMQLAEQQDVAAGMPFFIYSEKNRQDIINSLKREIAETVELDNEGIIAKADSLGSLEVLISLLRKEGFMISKASLGNITKIDIMNALSNLTISPLDAVIVGFNVEKEEGIDDERIKIIKGEVIYKIIEDLKQWNGEKQKELERERITGITMPCRIKVLPYVFRQSHPAIFGVHVEAGNLKLGIELMNSKGGKIGEIKAMQSEKKSIDKAEKNKEVAVSIGNITFGRQIDKGDILYSNLNEDEFRRLKENKKYLTADEIAVLQEIAQIKRQGKATWGI
jgi:translation initiation factor 5B